MYFLLVFVFSISICKKPVPVLQRVFLTSCKNKIVIIYHNVDKQHKNIFHIHSHFLLIRHTYTHNHETSMQNSLEQFTLLPYVINALHKHVLMQYTFLLLDHFLLYLRIKSECYKTNFN